MTNEQIIFTRSQELAKNGVIRYTGRTFTAEINGETVELMETEPIHTYAVWKKLGYQVQKGQKAVDSFTIWKALPGKKTEEDEEEQKIRMIMKKASFFSLAQVEKAGA